MEQTDYLALFFTLYRNPSSIPALTPETWDALIQYCTRLGVAPLLFSILSENKTLDLIPAEQARKLKRTYLANATINATAEKQLGELLNALNAQHIPVIPLKGAYLALKVYADPACRVMTDLDILVRKSDIPAAMKALEMLGCNIPAELWKSPGHHIPPIQKAGYILPLEVHWRLIPPSRMEGLAESTIWDRAQRTTLVGCACLALDPAHTIIHICQHAAYQHYFSNGLRAICDIEQIIKTHGEIDWPGLIETTKAIGAEKGILLALWITHISLGSPLAPVVQEAIAATHIPETVLQDALASLAGGIEYPDRPPEKRGESIGWWFGKIQKFLRANWLVVGVGKGNYLSLAWNATRMFYYRLRDNLNAAQRVSEHEHDESIQSQQRIRAWLR